MQKVPPLLLEEEKNKEDYIPKVVSIGPYHHGKPKLRLAEAFKPNAVQMFVEGGKPSRDFYSNVYAKIGEIRSCYEEGSTDAYSDCKLAEMMLYDACFIIVRIETNMPAKHNGEMSRIGAQMDTKYRTMAENLGRLNMALSHRDLLLVENQIPFWIVKDFITLRYSEVEGKKLLNRFLNGNMLGEYDSRSRLRREPFHLLDAFYMVVASNWNEPEHQNGHCLKCRRQCWEQCRQCFKCRWLCCFRVDQRPPASAENGVNPSTGRDLEAGVDPAAVADPGATTGVKCRCLGVCRKGPEVGGRREVQRSLHSFRSVMDLKKKGIRFNPSSSRSYLDVKFESGLFCPQLRLPAKFVSIHTKIFFLNTIAYELSPHNVTNYVVISYINLMKSLIGSKEDVAELRKRKILNNALGSDEQVLEVFRDINTYGDANRQIFREAKDKIEAHYNSRMKTWIGEVRDVHFRNPRTAIAWLAAISLIAIASASLYYSVRRGSNK
ncbi:UNVERIFIED_CONTAM: hypothetical protein Scaly_0839300 [Sesamum calycinum]|uniref:Uncharacterized protein n=1 Tax=Sesamum calycinum TaxID=2727403 RepID=A0AAW2RAF5_9LAMI